MQLKKAEVSLSSPVYNQDGARFTRPITRRNRDFVPSGSNCGTLTDIGHSTRAYKVRIQASQLFLVNEVRQPKQAELLVKEAVKTLQK